MSCATTPEPPAEQAEPLPTGGRPGGAGELLRLALPLILSSSFFTLQVTLDRVLLSRQDAHSVGAAMGAAMMFWTALILFQLGTGPIKGFAVTLGLGIITSFFTAVMVTRLIVVAWLNTMRPRKLTI